MSAQAGVDACGLCKRRFTVEEVLLEEILYPLDIPAVHLAGWDKPMHKECHEMFREKYWEPRPVGHDGMDDE